MSNSINRMRQQNIGHKEHGDTVDRSELVKGAFRQRADFVLQLHITASYSELIGTIKEIPFKGENQDGRTIMDETLSE
jgi:hypothetical protein